MAEETRGAETDSFASLLAALAAPTRSDDQHSSLNANNNRDPALLGPNLPGEDLLSEDVLALSYEHALREKNSPQKLQACEADTAQAPIADESRKSASVTLRMSHAECAQLKQRAAEAGLTVSAYLRSCTFEAEALRAQVKEALAALRTATPHTTQISASSTQETPRRWWRPWPHASSRSAQA